MGRKFRVLQIGGHDLGSLFKEKEDVEWDYLDDAVFHFESGSEEKNAFQSCGKY